MPKLPLHIYEVNFLPQGTRLLLNSATGVLVRSDRDIQVKLTLFETALVKVLLDRAPAQVPADEMVKALAAIHGDAESEMLLATVRATLGTAERKLTPLGLSISVTLESEYVLVPAMEKA